MHAALTLESQWHQQQGRINSTFELIRLLALTRAFEFSDTTQQLLDPTMSTSNLPMLIRGGSTQGMSAEVIKRVLNQRVGRDYGAAMKAFGQSRNTQQPTVPDE